MSQDNTITCDGCGADITYSGNSVGYRLSLVSEGMSAHPWLPVTDMMIHPPIDGTKHFCGLRCLETWVLEKATR